MVEPVNLLDPDVEPTDEQLSSLWREVAKDAHEKREKAVAALYQDIYRKTHEVRARYSQKAHKADTDQ